MSNQVAPAITSNSKRRTTTYRIAGIVQNIRRRRDFQHIAALIFQAVMLFLAELLPVIALLRLNKYSLGVAELAGVQFDMNEKASSGDSLFSGYSLSMPHNFGGPG